MRSTVVVLAVGLVVWCGTWLVMSAPVTSTERTADPGIRLQDLFTGKVRVVDLTYSLNSENPHWPGEAYYPFKLKTIATLEKDGVLSKAFSTPEHLGTHIDAPNHFAENQPSVDEIPLRQLFVPAVVIDVAIHVEQDADYQLRKEDIATWEERHGRIPERAVVLLHTGWGRHWDQPERYRNQDVRGRMHFPGFSAEAARFLLERRNVCGVGIDTLSIDRGLSQEFPVHRILNSAGRYGLENMAHLDRLPPRDFYLIVAPMKIEAGTGGPTRLFAVIPE